MGYQLSENVLDPYVFELIRPEGYAGRITEREYADDYYGDFFNYTRKWNPDVRHSQRGRMALWVPTRYLCLCLSVARQLSMNAVTSSLCLCLSCA